MWRASRELEIDETTPMEDALQFHLEHEEAVLENLEEAARANGANRFTTSDFLENLRGADRLMKWMFLCVT